MLAYFSTLIVTAMVTVSFGNYATSLIFGEGAAQVWVKIFAVGLVVLLTFVNSVGAEAAVKAQTAVVSIVLVVLSGFAIAMLVQMDPTMLSPATYPPVSNILASVALTFFAFLGFGVIAFTGGDIEDPKKNMPRAMYISIGFTMLLYVALAIGVFGTLSVEEVIANDDTALAVAALPIFGAADIP
jgi:amino acid transporter